MGFIVYGLMAKNYKKTKQNKKALNRDNLTLEN